MTEEVKLEAYLSISQKKFEIFLLDKKNFKNVYNDEVFVENSSDIIDYNLLSNFLENNIFKIEKLIGKFLKSIFVIIENKQILNHHIGIKKKNYEKKIDKKSLESSLIELKDLFKENYPDNKIMHIIISRYLIDGVNHSTFDKEIIGNHMCIELKFISVPLSLIREINFVLEKYQIKIDQYFDGEYLKSLFPEGSISLPNFSIMASKMMGGFNQNEIKLVSKNIKKRGFFEKFFQLFS